jgi:hypothetical protein
MQEKIEKELSVLVGLPLWDAGRGADLEWFHFGEHRQVADRKGRLKEIGEYALHVQCSWRIVSSDQVIVARRDLYYLPDGSVDLSDDFDWDKQMGNWRDVRMHAFLKEHGSQPLIVTAIKGGRAGSVSISFTEDFVLELFPDDSLSGEHWRFFRPSVDESHFVVTGEGIKPE